jgi:hypothetical protein
MKLTLEGGRAWAEWVVGATFVLMEFSGVSWSLVEVGFTGGRGENGEGV